MREGRGVRRGARGANAAAEGGGTNLAVLFDLDDTLLDDRGAQDAYLSDLYANHRHAFRGTEVDFRFAWRGAIDRHFPRYVRGEIDLAEQRRARVRDVFERPEMSSAEADRIVSEFVSGYESSWRIFPDVLNVLDRLGDIPLGVITNGSSTQQRAKLARTGILDRFSIVVVSEEAGCAKPSARIFLDACRALGVNPEQAVFVGDSWELDVEGSRGAGLRSIWVNRSAPATDCTSRMAATIPRVRSLTEIVERADLRALLELEAGIQATT